MGVDGGLTSWLRRYQITGFRYRGDQAGTDDLGVLRFLPARPGRSAVENLAGIATQVATSALKCSEWGWVRRL
jgi:hypothetical protein